MLFTSIVQTVVMGILVGTVWLQIGTAPSSTIQRQPVLFFCTINQGMFGALMVINSFPSERMLTLRERAAGSYFASAYFAAKSMAEAIFQLVIPILFSVTVYFLIGLQTTASQFFIFMGFMCLCNMAAVSLAMAVSAIFRTTEMAVIVLPMALEVSRLYGGFFVSPGAMPVYYSWLQAVSYCNYAYVGVSLNELQGLKLSCTPLQIAAGTVCTGEQTIQQLDLNYLTMSQCAGILLSYIFICRLVCYFALRYIKW